MKKILILLIPILFIAMSAISTDSRSIEDVINSDPISETAVVSVSVKETGSGNVLYARDDKFLLHPASVMKAFSMPYILNKLGKDYKLTTSFYTSPSGKTLYIKLSGDPLFKTGDLSAAVKRLKADNINRIECVIIDDKIIDEVNWGVGWMHDDDENPYMPKYSAYNINRNISYKGIPVKDPKQNFIGILKYLFKQNAITFNGAVKSGNIPSQSVLRYKVNRDLPEVLNIIGHKSDNLAAETLLKIASRDANNLTGSTKQGISELKTYYEQLGINSEGMIIVDASGVSHNNLISTDWMTSVLLKVNDMPYAEIYRQSLPSPGTGTLRNRLEEYSGRLYAKTGTLSAISGIAGYVKSDSGKVYAFALLIQNYEDTDKAKELEDKIIKGIMKL